MRCIVPDCGKDALARATVCDRHVTAPAWQRAAWMSAHKRKAGRAPAAIAGVELEIYDASNIAPRLWIGAKPPLDRSYPGIDMIVLCAAEYQPRKFPHYDKSLIHCPIPDDALDTMEQGRALTAAKHVASALKSGKRVLSTCQQGRNRSALVAALALGMISRATPDQVIQLIREKRMATCLTNPHFCEYLVKYARNRP